MVTSMGWPGVAAGTATEASSGIVSGAFADLPDGDGSHDYHQEADNDR